MPVLLLCLREKMGTVQGFKTWGLGFGSSGSTPAYQAQGPGFKPKYHTHTKKRLKENNQMWCAVIKCMLIWIN
jgi:hypothetical protein